MLAVQGFRIQSSKVEVHVQWKSLKKGALSTKLKFKQSDLFNAVVGIISVYPVEDFQQISDDYYYKPTVFCAISRFLP